MQTKPLVPAARQCGERLQETERMASLMPSGRSGLQVGKPWLARIIKAPVDRDYPDRVWRHGRRKRPVVGRAELVCGAPECGIGIGIVQRCRRVLTHVRYGIVRVVYTNFVRLKP